MVRMKYLKAAALVQCRRRNKNIFVIIFSFAFLSIGKAQEPRWWKLFHLKFNESNKLSHWQSLLDRRQRILIGRQAPLVEIFANSIKNAAAECERRFHGLQWSCTISKDMKSPLFGNITDKACRETAFIYALVSASAVQGVAKACSEGVLPHCSCDPYRRGPKDKNGWKWGGCSDNIPYAIRLTRKFTKIRAKDPRSKMNAHNYEAGRAHVRASAKDLCACTGIFASCTKKTCWRSVSSLSKVSDRLMRRFSKATKLPDQNDFRGEKKNKSPKRRRRHLSYPTKKDLVYLEESPNFCSTKRKCDLDSDEMVNCRTACCHGFYRKKYMEPYHCNCVLSGCRISNCDVKCRICFRPIQQTYCY